MAKSRVLIIGGGFGGAFTAKYLSKYGADSFEVELISDRNYFVFQPLLPEIASGTLNAQDSVTPLRLLLPGVSIRLAEVKGIDFSRKIVKVLQGRKLVAIEVAYDHLVIASGQITDLSLFPGFPDHSMCMKDLADAYRLRNHVIQCLELADITENPELKKMALTFVVAGGGFSGVETIGEMTEMIRRTLKYYPNIEAQEINPILIQRGKRVLPEMEEKLGDYALKALSKAGIDVRLSTGIDSATSTCIRTADGRVIKTLTSVTTVGNGPSPFLKSLDLSLERGKIAVSRTFEVPEHDSVWALGDAALVPMLLKDGSQTYAPPTAQFAVRQARALAKNLVAREQGRVLDNFCYRPLGMLASLGNYKGVATIMGVSVTGLAGWLLWRGLYIGMLPGFSTRLRVALNWLFDYVMPRTIVHMAHEQSAATRYMHYAKGDQVYETGHVLKGFYTVISGSFEMCIESATGDPMIKQFKVGDHWGERMLEQEIPTTGRVTALENSVVLVMQADDFKRFRNAFGPMADYFKNIDDARYSILARSSNP